MATFSRPFGSTSGSETEPTAEELQQIELEPTRDYSYYAAAAELGYDLSTETFKGVRIA